MTNYRQSSSVSLSVACFYLRVVLKHDQSSSVKTTKSLLMAIQGDFDFFVFGGSG